MLVLPRAILKSQRSSALSNQIRHRSKFSASKLKNQSPSNKMMVQQTDSPSKRITLPPPAPGIRQGPIKMFKMGLRASKPEPKQERKEEPQEEKQKRYNIRDRIDESTICDIDNPSEAKNFKELQLFKKNKKLVTSKRELNYLTCLSEKYYTRYIKIEYPKVNKDGTIRRDIFTPTTEEEKNILESLNIPESEHVFLRYGFHKGHNTVDGFMKGLIERVRIQIQRPDFYVNKVLGLSWYPDPMELGSVNLFGVPSHINYLFRIVNALKDNSSIAIRIARETMYEIFEIARNLKDINDRTLAIKAIGDLFYSLNTSNRLKLVDDYVYVNALIRLSQLTEAVEVWDSRDSPLATTGRRWIEQGIVAHLVNDEIEKSEYLAKLELQEYSYISPSVLVLLIDEYCRSGKFELAKPWVAFFVKIIEEANIISMEVSNNDTSKDTSTEEDFVRFLNKKEAPLHLHVTRIIKLYKNPKDKNSINKLFSLHKSDISEHYRLIKSETNKLWAILPPGKTTSILEEYLLAVNTSFKVSNAMLRLIKEQIDKGDCGLLPVLKLFWNRFFLIEWKNTFALLVLLLRRKETELADEILTFLEELYWKTPEGRIPRIDISHYGLFVRYYGNRGKMAKAETYVDRVINYRGAITESFATDYLTVCARAESYNRGLKFFIQNNESMVRETYAFYDMILRFHRDYYRHYGGKLKPNDGFGIPLKFLIPGKMDDTGIISKKELTLRGHQLRYSIISFRALYAEMLQRAFKITPQLITKMVECLLYQKDFLGASAVLKHQGTVLKLVPEKELFSVVEYFCNRKRQRSIIIKADVEKGDHTTEEYAKMVRKSIEQQLTPPPYEPSEKYAKEVKKGGKRGWIFLSKMIAKKFIKRNKVLAFREDLKELEETFATAPIIGDIDAHNRQLTEALKKRQAEMLEKREEMKQIIEAKEKREREEMLMLETEEESIEISIGKNIQDTEIGGKETAKEIESEVET